MADKTVYKVPVTVAPEAIVIWCSDPRFQEAILQFVWDELKLAPGTYVPFTVDGGSSALGRPSELPKEFKFIKDRLELFREHFTSIKRVVIINHEDCAHYRMLSGKLGALLPFHKHLECDDMKLIKTVFQKLLAHLGMKLELYYAKFVDESHTQITIEPA